MHTSPRVVPIGSTSRKNKRKLEFLCVLWDMYISIHVHVAWTVLETCTLTFHLHVHVAWIVLDTYTCGLDSFG